MKRGPVRQGQEPRVPLGRPHFSLVPPLPGGIASCRGESSANLVEAFTPGPVGAGGSQTCSPHLPGPLAASSLLLHL